MKCLGVSAVARLLRNVREIGNETGEMLGRSRGANARQDELATWTHSWQFAMHPLGLAHMVTLPRSCSGYYSGTTGADRVLSRGGSEGSIGQTFAYVRSTSTVASTSLALEGVVPDGLVGQDQSGAAILRRGTEHTLGAVLEDREASESPRGKIVKFGPGRSRSRSRSSGGDAIIAHVALDGVDGVDGVEEVKPSLGVLADSKKGGRRYSMDDYGVSIAHRVELQTSQVVLPTRALA